MPTRYTLPEPFEELDHTGDVGVLVRGRDPEEALARLVLALASLMCGGGPVEPVYEREIEVPPLDYAAMAIQVLREQLVLFALGREIVAAVEVVRFAPDLGARLRVSTGPYDPVAHVEGGEIKAVTLHGASFAQSEDGWVAQVIFDV